MLSKNKNIALVLLITALILSSCFMKQHATINIVDIKTSIGVNDKLMPVRITNSFPAGTQKVFCWFQWKNTKVSTMVVARWYFLTDDIHILDYNFLIPRKEGTGSVSLTMPEGKQLPTGLYRVDLTLGKEILKSDTFKVQ